MAETEPRRLAISFSGGETSGYMAQWILANWRDRYDEMRVTFANTGQENEETLEFVQRCDEFFGLGVVWVEAVVHPGVRKGSTHRVVDFRTASRNGEPFEAVIAKYGIPNQASRGICTRELKLNAMRSYLDSVGWPRGLYDTAIGIRADEMERGAEASAAMARLVYPLKSEHPRTKPQINAYWAAMPFRLSLKGYQGNCKWCWKKTLRKHLTIISEHPEFYDFPERMEREYGMTGARATKLGKPQTFFRQERSTLDLRALAALGGFQPATDDAVAYPDDELDISAGCSESCEVYEGDGDAKA